MREEKEASRARIEAALSDPGMTTEAKAYIVAYASGYRLRKKKNRYTLLDAENLRTVAGEDFSFSAEAVLNFILYPPVSHEELHTDVQSDY